MKTQTEEKVEDVAQGPPSKGGRRRQVDNDVEPGLVRVKLPQTIGAKAREVVAELKARGGQVTLDELLSPYLEAIPEGYFDEQLLQRTPEPYYLEAAAKVPELREMLIRHAKKGLMRAAPPEHQRGTRRRRKNVEATEEAASGAAVVSGSGQKEAQ